jgi:hypothetical protein
VSSGLASCRQTLIACDFARSERPSVRICRVIREVSVLTIEHGKIGVLYDIYTTRKSIGTLLLSLLLHGLGNFKGTCFLDVVCCYRLCFFFVWWTSEFKLWKGAPLHVRARILLEKLVELLVWALEIFGQLELGRAGRRWGFLGIGIFAASRPAR